MPAKVLGMVFSVIRDFATTEVNGGLKTKSNQDYVNSRESS
jgi:hypothetical protein